MALCAGVAVRCEGLEQRCPQGAGGHESEEAWEEALVRALGRLDTLESYFGMGMSFKEVLALLLSYSVIQCHTVSYSVIQ